MALINTPATPASSGFDIERARSDTPGVARVAHLNNAGAALPPSQVTDAVIAHLRRESEMGGYEAAEAAADQVEHTYGAIAQLVGAARMRSRSWRTPPGPGTWPSTGWPSVRATGS